MDVTERQALTAAEAARLVAGGAVSSQELVEACLARTNAPGVPREAWAFLDGDHAMAQARHADAWRLEGRATGPLHGVPVAVDDVFDTADMPTELGSALHAGRVPARDATAVSALRGAGAVILGKTATWELGAGAASTVPNPHDPARSPGGSSGGAAAVVAAAMAPVAIGREGDGSTIRPASYCGVFGFRPTRGLVSRHGMLRLSRTLDQVGLLARGLEDIALLTEILAGHDAADPDSQPRARVAYRAIVASEPPVTPMLAFVRLTGDEGPPAETHEAFAELLDLLGDRVEEIEVSVAAAEAEAWHGAVAEAELALSLAAEWARAPDRLSSDLGTKLERGREVLARDYLAALAKIPRIHEGFEDLFGQRYDAILTPATAGTAPRGHAQPPEGFCTLWALAGMPSLCVPLMSGADGLPLGVQLVGPLHGDARLLRTARWLVERVAASVTS